MKALNLTLKFPGFVTQTRVTRLLLLLSLIFSGFAYAQPNPPSADQAFQFKHAYSKDGKSINTSWFVEPGNYLYREKFQFHIVNPAPVTLGKPKFPKTNIIKKYPTGEEMQAFTGHFTIKLPLRFQQSYSGRIKLRVRYQGCSELGICYPMQSKVATVSLSGTHPTEIKFTPLSLQHISNGEISSQDKITELLNNQNIFSLITAFFVIGVLLSLTPCVLPMIPILSGIIIGQKKVTHKRSFLLSVIYVLAMSLTYAVLGVFVGLIGSSIQAALQTPWVIVLFTLIFVAMALSLFGLYSFQLPDALRNKIANVNVHQKRGSYVGTFIMGCLSTLILSPCVTPPLASAIIFIGNSGDAAQGGLALFAMGLGMGLPLLIIGASSAKLLPKAGAWMNSVKYFLGVVMLGVAIWMLSRIIPSEYTMALWAMLAIGSAIGLRAFSSTSTKPQLFGKTIGIVLFVYGLILLLGALQGQTNPLKPFALLDQSTGNRSVLQFKTVDSLKELQQELKRANKLNKPVMLDFYANWCIACKEMDAYTFTNPQVKNLLKSYLLLRADVTANNSADQALQKHFKVVAPPTILFFNSNGKEIKSSRVVGEMSAAKFIQHLQKL